MKKLYIASGLVALLAAATSCDKYDIYPEQYGEVMMIKDAGDRPMTIYATEDASPCYISVMKSGHTPENPAQATLKILTDREFGDYKELYYGRRDFEGIVAMHPWFYRLTDASGNVQASGQMSHDFVDENDRYFGANVVFDAQKVSDWHQQLVEDAEWTPKRNDTPEFIAEMTKRKEAALDTLNNKTMVVPVGLFSASDSINADNKYLMIMPNVENPVLQVSVENGGYSIAEIARADLRDENSAFRNGTYDPDVTLSIPCPNPYGFKVKFSNAGDPISNYNDCHEDIVMKELLFKPLGAGYETYQQKDGNNFIKFPKGKTEVRLPLSIYRKYMDYDDLENNWMIPIQLRPNNSKIDMVWNDPSVTVVEAPEKVQKSLKLPNVQMLWTSNKTGQTIEINSYTFYVGYRVVEAPLEMTGDSFVFANDCEPTEGSFEALFDDDLSTFYHSAWSDPQPRSTPYGSYIDMIMPTKEPINRIAIQLTARVHANPHSPKVVSLYYSNIDNDDERNASWKLIKTVEIQGTKTGNAGSGQSYWIGGIKKESDWIVAPEKFRYLRFCVLKNAQDEDLTVTGTSGAGYWNLAEMKIYGKTE